jgi:hypothetical protein
MEVMCSEARARIRESWEKADGTAAALPCEPDQRTFNLVLKCWAASFGRDGHGAEGCAAQRAEDILGHMELRYECGRTSLRPDVAAYNTVLTAWARQAAVSAASSSPTSASNKRMVTDAVGRAERLLGRMERSGPDGAKPNALSYNIVIHALAQEQRVRDRASRGASGPSIAASAAPLGVIDPAERALDVLSRMKRLSREEGRSECDPDVYTYAGVCDALAKVATPEASRRAEDLLLELEDRYRSSRSNQHWNNSADDCDEMEEGLSSRYSLGLKPNLQLYTSVRYLQQRFAMPERFNFY